MIKAREEGIDNFTLITSPPPHIHAAISVDRIVHMTITSLLPGVVWLLYLFGWQAFRVMSLSIGAAVLTEIIILKLRKKDLTVTDGTAVLTGLILAMTLSPTVSSWIVVVGAVLAITLGKHVFGGTGSNPFNPAVVGRIFLASAFSGHMSNWIAPLSAGVAAKSPLELWVAGEALPSYRELILGTAGGFMGEFIGLALLFGGLVLIARGYVDWKVPLSFLVSVAVFTAILGQDPVWHLLAGGVMLGAFYLAGDPVTNPMTPWGRVVFGAGAGLCLVVIRIYGQNPDGLFYGILMMNGLAPLLNRYLRARRREVPACEKH